MRKILQNILASLSRQIINRYKPTVIGITGSVGKTSAKEAIYCVVSQKFRARRPEKNFNNEIGLPLTIIGEKSPGRNPVLWLKTLLKAVYLLIFKQKYPQVLVLEMGVDRPEDMDHLLSIARPTVAVITNIGLSHYEFFQDAETIEQEKGKIAEVLKPGETLIVNADNESAFRQSKKTKAKVLSYGLKNGSGISAYDLQEQLANPSLTSFSVITPRKTFQASIKALGETHISGALAAIAVGESLNMEIDLIKAGLKEYKPAPGRLNVIAGIKHTTIIDDTYNSAPDSMVAALKLLKKFPQEIKIAVLGDMLELGNISEQAHRTIGEIAASLNLHKLITVGPQGKVIAQASKDAGLDPDKVLSFDHSDEAQRPVQNLLIPDSVILIKGSQGMRMEKITKEIMAEPMRAQELLCRQYGKWLQEN